MPFNDYVLNLEGHQLRNPFWRELEEEGTLTFRDNFQFELKSEFFIDPNASETNITQEFYLFVPKTLQINADTYSPNQFYQDQISLIRFKTPHLNFKQLIDVQNPRSPLYRIQTTENKELNLKEMILFGNMFRTSLRFRVRKLLKKIRTLPENELVSFLDDEVMQLMDDVSAARLSFSRAKHFLISHDSEKKFVDQLHYVEEYISIVCEEYLALLLKVIREQNNPQLEKADVLLCELLDEETTYRKNTEGFPETILYHEGLLEKFMITALKLVNTRVEVKTKYGNLISAIAAGVAMLIYMTLLVWNASTTVINSTAFVILAVFLYIIKDRIKEGMKVIYHRNIGKWLSDFRTKIYNSDGMMIGRLSETFYFLTPEKLPREYQKLRLADIADPLESYQPDEFILYYKKQIKLYKIDDKLNEINTFFRFNIHKFLEKANDALQPTLELDPETHDLIEILLPKVYHLHLLIKSNFINRQGKKCEEIKTFCIVIDKNGIRRVEQISSIHN